MSRASAMGRSDKQSFYTANEEEEDGEFQDAVEDELPMGEIE